jgi:hypothetical protein
MGPHQRVVRGPQVEPPLITKPGGQIGRAHDVGEHHGGEDAILCRHRTSPGQEFLDLIKDRLSVDEGGYQSVPGSSTYLAPGMCSASYRPIGAR